MPDIGGGALKSIPWDRLSDGFNPFMDIAINEFLLVLELDEELRAVVARREEGAFVAQQQTAAAGDLVHQGLHVSSDLFRRLVVTVMPVGAVRLGIAPIEPPECHRRLAIAGGELEANLRLERVSFLVNPRGLGLDFHRVTELERAEGHVDGMAGHVPQGPSAKILPPAPVERQIDSPPRLALALAFARRLRSEEHTSELQS